MSTPEVSIVIPVLNGAPLLDRACDEIAHVMAHSPWSFEIVIVDDGSSDRTWATATAICRADDRVRAIRLERNVGQALAIARGIEVAAGAIVATIDVDLETASADLPLVIAAVADGAPLAVARRLARRAWRREAPSLAFNIHVRATGIPLRDAGCGTRAMRRSVADAYAATPDLGRELPMAVLADVVPRPVEVAVRSTPPHGSQLRGRDLVRLWLAFDARRSKPSSSVILLAAVAVLTGRRRPSLPRLAVSGVLAAWLASRWRHRPAVRPGAALVDRAGSPHLLGQVDEPAGVRPADDPRDQRHDGEGDDRAIEQPASDRAR